MRHFWQSGSGSRRDDDGGAEIPLGRGRAARLEICRRPDESPDCGHDDANVLQPHVRFATGLWRSTLPHDSGSQRRSWRSLPYRTPSRPSRAGRESLTLAACRGAREKILRPDHLHFRRRPSRAALFVPMAVPQRFDTPESAGGCRPPAALSGPARGRTCDPPGHSRSPHLLGVFRLCVPTISASDAAFGRHLVVGPTPPELRSGSRALSRGAADVDVRVPSASRSRRLRLFDKPERRSPTRLDLGRGHALVVCRPGVPGPRSAPAPSRSLCQLGELGLE